MKLLRRLIDCWCGPRSDENAPNPYSIVRMELSDLLWLLKEGETLYGTERMSDDLWQMPTRDLMLNSVPTRATHYRRQAAELRGMAENQIDESVRCELLDLAVKYDALANFLSTK
jgi:hypothetical protein